MNQTLENQNPFMKEQIIQLINDLNEKGIEQIFEYATFLKFRTQTKIISATSLPQNATQLAKESAEFSENEKKLNQLGMNETQKTWNKLRALEAMKKLKGSGNGQLITALLNERQKERLQNG